MMYNDIIILDGGMGHELKSRGISDGSFLAGVLANEDTSGGGAAVVESIHYDFLNAGCDVITTNSFVAVPPRMIECGLASNEDDANLRVSRLIAAAVERAKAAIAKYIRMHGNAGRPKSIAGCVPPISECYFAEKVPQMVELVPGYKTIISALVENGVDMLLAETLSTAREASAILQAMSCIEQAKTLPLWISFTIHDYISTQLRSGELLVDVCQTIIKQSKSLNISVEAIGVNCSTPVAISSALDILAKELLNTDIKCIVYGNCFQTTTSEWIRSLDSCNALTTRSNDSLHDKYDASGYLFPDAYARYAYAWANAGAKIIGGCCGCNPKHMKAVSSALLRDCAIISVP